MSNGQLGVLHTDSSYMFSAPPLPFQAEDVKMLRLQLQISTLKGKEQDFANRFGYSSIEEMIAGIRKILKSSPKDMEALRQFSSENLKKHLEQFKNKYGQALKGQKVRLTFTTDKTKNEVNKIFNASGGNGSVTWTMSGDVQFDIEWNTPAVKSIVNKMRGTHFQTAKDNISNLREYILNRADTLIEVVEGQSSKKMETYLIENTASPFGLKKDDVKFLEKTNRPALVQLEQNIKNFIYNELCAGASGAFKKAVQTVMAQKISQLSDITFFMGGGGWVTHAIGAFGELQAAILFQYIANQTPNKILATRISQIIGDDVNGYNQQLHTDIEILKAFGVQVKNYNSSYNSRLKQERTVDVHLHPTEVAALGASEGVVDYIVNSYFNTSISPYPVEELSRFFESHASELLNLDLNPKINDQVTFYMIGTNFIPGSVILEQAFIEMKLKTNTTISGQMGKSDYEYNSPTKAYDWGRPFHEWWRSDSYDNISVGNFTPTGKNSIGAWDSKISITTRFTYSALWGGDYDLLK